jgi:hypothetical protein
MNEEDIQQPTTMGTIKALENAIVSFESNLLFDG